MAHKTGKKKIPKKKFSRKKIMSSASKKTQEDKTFAMICPNMLNKDPHVIKLDRLESDSFCAFYIFLCHDCNLEVKIPMDKEVSSVSELEELIKKLRQNKESSDSSNSSKSTHKCVCDFQTVVLPYGCQCGGY